MFVRTAHQTPAKRAAPPSPVLDNREPPAKRSLQEQDSVADESPTRAFFVPHPEGQEANASPGSAAESGSGSKVVTWLRIDGVSKATHLADIA